MCILPVLARLWSTVNLFYRAGERIQRALQRNEDAQRTGQREQDGSEVKSAELERHIAEGITLLERRNAFEFIRDYAADLFEAQTGSAWQPRTGSKVSHANMTAAMIDSRDFLSARRHAETEVLIPASTKIAFSGDNHYNDHEAIWDALDRAHAKFSESRSGASEETARERCRQNVQRDRASCRARSRLPSAKPINSTR